VTKAPTTLAFMFPSSIVRRSFVSTTSIMLSPERLTHAFPGTTHLQVTKP